MDIVRSWKPELKELGLVWKKGAVYFANTRNEPLQLIVSVQRNLHSSTFKINPSILLCDPFVSVAEGELFLQANVRRDGIYLHVTAASWWPAAELGEALGALKKYALPWFQEWGRPGRLVEILETAIREEKGFIQVAEPLPDEATRVPWHHDLPKQRITPMFFQRAAILHYLNHNITKAVLRTQDWIASMAANEADLKAKAQSQLAALEKIKIN
jgi:hypothetical protein